MAHRKAKKHLMQCDDFILISRHKNVLQIDVANNNSPNIIADLAVANKHFETLLREIVRVLDNENESKTNTDQPSEGRSEQSENAEQGTIQEAETIN